MKFSVITVCLNSVQTIERTIQSVISQENVDLEYIIVDGGSKDGTLEIIKNYEKEITKYISEPDKGLYDAMNKGVSMATGDVISFLNSDDWYEKNIFPLLEKAFEQNQCDIISGRQALIRDGGIVGYSIRERAETDIYISMIYPHPSLFVKRTLFLEHGGFDLQYKICADYDWILRIYEQRAIIRRIDLVTTNFSAGGLSTGRRCIEERKEISIRHLPENMKEHYIHRIIAFYQKSIDILNLTTAIDLIKTNEAMRRKLKQTLDNRLHWSEKCHLVGTGLRAHECAELIDILGMKIGHVYDNDKTRQGMKYWGRIVEKPDKVEDDNTWIITSTFYENEIERQIKEIGIKRYVIFSEVIKIISEFVEENVIYSNNFVERKNKEVI